MLFDSHKDAVSGKILVFGNILSLLGVNWVCLLRAPRTINNNKQ